MAVNIGLTLQPNLFRGEFEDKFLTTSAAGAVVVGFARQDTLGNAFAGLAIQSEKPFHIRHWIRVGEFEGRVAEVTWRATKLRTQTGNFIIEPERREVATMQAGAYFGEMSLLTGEPRTATVVARGDAVVVEIDAEGFRPSAPRIRTL